MILLLAITGAALLIMGATWWHVSAERSASLFIASEAGMLIVAAALLASKFDVRGCNPDTPTLDAARGKVACPLPGTTMYGLRGVANR